MNKVNPLPDFTARFGLIFLSNLSGAFKVILFTIIGKSSLVNKIATIINASLYKLPNQGPNYPSD